LINAQEQSRADEYVDKKLLDGKAVFEMTIEQFGNAIQVSFDAAYSNGHGAAPEGHWTSENEGEGHAGIYVSKIVLIIREPARSLARGTTLSCR
jgi:hypothetical protein